MAEEEKCETRSFVEEKLAVRKRLTKGSAPIALKTRATAEERLALFNSNDPFQDRIVVFKK